MVQRFFFNGVNVYGNGFAVNIGIKYAVEILPDSAKSVFLVADPAMVSAKEAVDEPVFQFLVE